MTTSLVAAYRKGAITADHLVVRCLNLVDPTAPGHVLAPLPPELLTRMLDFARQYRPGEMVTNYGVLPTPDQIRAATHWIEEAHVHRSPPSPSDPNSIRPGLSGADPGEHGPAPVGDVHAVE